jgi:glycosyltransferase involved in cell wall biosynthesis
VGPRICLNALNAVMGGGITVVRQLAGRLARARPDWHFVLYVPQPEAAPADPPANLEVRVLASARGRLARWAWEQLRLPGVLRRESFDGMLCLGGFTCFASRVPQISVWQNPNVMSRLEIPRSAGTRLLIHVQRLFQGLSLRKTSYNVFQTADSKRLAADRWPRCQVPDRVIHWGLDTGGLPSAPAPLSRREPIALAVGHTFFHKNYEALIEAMAVYGERHGGPLKLQIAGGPYEAAYHRSLLERVAERGVGDRVEFLGAVPAEQMGALYERAAVYVSTSLLETFGLAPLEAMGHGLPVLVTRTTCLPEVCGDAADYVNPGKPEDLAAALQRLFSDREHAEELRARGLERVRAFRWERTAEEFAEVFEQLLELAPAMPVQSAR